MQRQAAVATEVILGVVRGGATTAEQGLWRGLPVLVHGSAIIARLPGIFKSRNRQVNNCPIKNLGSGSVWLDRSFAGFEKRDQLGNRPLVILKPCRHRRGHAKRLMATAEVVVDKE